MHTFITLQPKFQNCKISPALPPPTPPPPPLGLLQNLPPTPECRLGSVFVCPGWLPVITLYPTTLSQPLTFMSNLSAQNSNVPNVQSRATNIPKKSCLSIMYKLSSYPANSNSNVSICSRGTSKIQAVGFSLSTYLRNSHNANKKTQ